MIIKILFFFGCSLLFVFSVGLLSSGQRTSPNTILTGVLAACFAWTFVAALSATGTMEVLPHFNKTHLPFLCLTGPLWYFYIRASVINDNPKKRFRPHVFPSLLCILLTIPFYLQSAEFKNQYVETQVTDITTISVFIATRIADLSAFAYLVLSACLLKKSFKNNAGAPPRFKFRLKALAIVTGLALVASLLRLFGIFGQLQELAVVIPTLIIFASGALMFCLSNRYPGVLHTTSIVSKTDQSEKRCAEDNELAQMETYTRQIVEQQLHLDPRITLATVADALNVQPHMLSKLTNLTTHSNFKCLINTLRIKHAQTLLTDRPELSVLEIAYASGFNSKSVFYKHFVKLNGETPLEYREKKIGI